MTQLKFLQRNEGEILAQMEELNSHRRRGALLGREFYQRPEDVSSFSLSVLEPQGEELHRLILKPGLSPGAQAPSHSFRRGHTPHTLSGLQCHQVTGRRKREELVTEIFTLLQGDLRVRKRTSKHLAIFSGPRFSQR